MVVSNFQEDKMYCPYSRNFLLLTEQVTWALFSKTEYLMEYETWDDMFHTICGR